MKRTGSQIFVEALKAEGVEDLFCYPGGAVLIFLRIVDGVEG